MKTVEMLSFNWSFKSTLVVLANTVMGIGTTPER